MCPTGIASFLPLVEQLAPAAPHPISGAASRPCDGWCGGSGESPRRRWRPAARGFSQARWISWLDPWVFYWLHPGEIYNVWMEITNITQEQTKIANWNHSWLMNEKILTKKRINLTKRSCRHWRNTWLHFYKWVELICWIQSSSEVRVYHHFERI